MMHTFVYGSRVIENEQQIRLERKFRKVGNWVHSVVKFFVAFLFFVVLNTLISNLAQHTNGLFTVHTWRILEEGVRILFVDNAFSTSSLAYQHAMRIVAALAVVVCNEHCALALSTTGGGTHKTGQSARVTSEKNFKQLTNTALFLRK